MNGEQSVLTAAISANQLEIVQALREAGARFDVGEPKAADETSYQAFNETHLALRCSDEAVLEEIADDAGRSGIGTPRRPAHTRRSAAARRSCRRTRRQGSDRTWVPVYSPAEA